MVRATLFRDTPSIIRRATVVTVTALVLVVLGGRIASIFAPPPLAITSPPDQLSTSSRIITIIGRTAPGAALTINGAVLAPDATGAFATDVVLLPGANTIEIQARVGHSRPATVRRLIHALKDSAPLAKR